MHQVQGQNHVLMPYNNESTLIYVRATTKASVNAVKNISNGRLCVFTTSVPENGKANRCIMKLLSKFLSIPVSRISLHSGAKSRDKVFLVEGVVTESYILEKLEK